MNNNQYTNKKMLPLIQLNTSKRSLKKDFNLKDLKNFCSLNHMVGYSNLNKSKLVNYIFDFLKEKRVLIKKSPSQMDKTLLKGLKKIGKRMHISCSRMNKKPLINCLLSPLKSVKTTRKTHLYKQSKSSQSKSSNPHIEDEKEKEKENEKMKRFKRQREERKKRERERIEFNLKMFEKRKFWEIFKVKTSLHQSGLINKKEYEDWVDSHKPTKKIPNRDLAKTIKNWEERIIKAQKKGLGDLSKEFKDIRNEKVMEYYNKNGSLEGLEAMGLKINIQLS